MHWKSDLESLLLVLKGAGAGVLVLPFATARWLRASRPHRVRCPDNRRRTTVRLDPMQTALGVTRQVPPRIVDCAFWPERGDCDRRCAAALCR